jgi:hypothetical protein
MISAITTINPNNGMKNSQVAVLISVLVLIAIWDGVWKAVAMWKCGRNNQLAWFICIVVFNTAGILPILYILFFQKKGAPSPAITT